MHLTKNSVKTGLKLSKNFNILILFEFSSFCPSDEQKLVFQSPEVSSKAQTYVLPQSNFQSLCAQSRTRFNLILPFERQASVHLPDRNWKIQTKSNNKKPKFFLKITKEYGEISR